MPDVTKDPLESEPKAGDDDFRLTLDEGPPSDRRDSDRPKEIGRTSGGGNLGHNQPDDVVRDTKNRNATGSDEDPPTLATESHGELRRDRAEAPGRNATGAKAELVMPRDDATLKTKI